MHIIFSEDEKKWIDKKLFNWTVKSGCPEDVRKSIEVKLKVLYKEHERFPNKCF